MGLETTGTNYLLNTSSAVTGYPFTVGFWLRPETTSTFMFSLANPAATNVRYYCSTSSGWVIYAQAGGTAVISTAVGTVTTGTWNYVLLRYISATNRRIDVLQADGTIVNGQSVASVAPAATTTSMYIGILGGSTPSSGISGGIAEFWYTNTDVQGDGAAISPSLIRQLAYGGPYSVPYIIKDIQEYLSLRSTLTSDQFSLDEYDFGGAGRKTWTNVNAAKLGRHPPLPYWYEKPIDIAKNIPI